MFVWKAFDVFILLHNLGKEWSRHYERAAADL